MNFGGGEARAEEALWTVLCLCLCLCTYMMMYVHVCDYMFVSVYVCLFISLGNVFWGMCSILLCCVREVWQKVPVAGVGPYASRSGVSGYQQRPICLPKETYK